jgi:hypothetical protein
MSKLRARFGRRSQSSRQRGATIPEYALLLSMIVVGSLGAITKIQTDSEAELQERADCVAAIPGSLEAEQCGYQATTTTNTGPTSSGSTAPTVPTTPTTVATTATTVATTASTVATTATTATTVVTTATTATTATTLPTSTTAPVLFQLALSSGQREAEGDNFDNPSAPCPNQSGGGWWCSRVRVRVTRVSNGAAVAGVTASVSYNKENNYAGDTGTQTCLTDAQGYCWLTPVQQRDSQFANIDIDFVVYSGSGTSGGGGTWNGNVSTLTVNKP